jgi:SAM-dependent MidA family methyltransferase
VAQAGGMTEPTPLAKRLIAEIARSGPIWVADYMTRCLLDPTDGYYTNRQPFGTSGDFVTAPEISQMFGELLGLCLAQSWLDQGSPARFILAELGPGKGTLMADLLRATARVPGFAEAAQIWLVEASEKMQAGQAEALSGHDLNFATTVSDLPDGPLFLIANEFFDCLPIRQYRRTGAGWQEQMVGAVDGALGFILGAALPDHAVPEWAADLPEGALIETSPASVAIAGDMARRISESGGLAVIVDYGDWNSAGDTLQALRGHRKIGPLAAPGQSDLTAHVNFAELAAAASGRTAVTAPTPQGLLLERLGISARAAALAQTASGDRLAQHEAAHRRLTHPDEMGQLFKAIAFYPEGENLPAGFDP